MLCNRNCILLIRQIGENSKPIEALSRQYYLKFIRFYCIIRDDMFLSFYDAEVNEQQKDTIIELVINSLGITIREMARVDFWGSTGESSRNTLLNYLVGLIAATKDGVLIKNIPGIKEQFMNLTKENQRELQGINLDN